MNKKELPWWAEEALMFLVFGVLCTAGEKIVEHAEQAYLAWKFKKEAEKKKRERVSKKQRR